MSGTSSNGAVITLRPYTITEASEKRGGDSYMGFCETYAEVARDSIEIVEVWDTVYGCNRPTLPGILNKFYERKKLY